MSEFKWFPQHAVEHEMPEFEWYPVVTINPHHFVEFVDTLPTKVLLEENRITVKLRGATDVILNYTAWTNLAHFVMCNSDYWRVDYFTDHLIMDVKHTYEGHTDTNRTHDVRVILRAVGVEDL